MCAYGGFLAGQQAARWMLRQGSGAILFTGASASVKGYARSAPSAMGKFSQRGLAQSIARELSPRNIRVAHFVIDGVVRRSGRSETACSADSELDPDAIAQTYTAILDQPRSAWTWEIELRPWVLRRRLVGIVGTQSASLHAFQWGHPTPSVSCAISMCVTAARNALSSPWMPPGQARR